MHYIVGLRDVKGSVRSPAMEDAQDYGMVAVRVTGITYSSVPPV
jgi:hypothetical protein